MRWDDAIALSLAENPLLARLSFAALELLVLTLVLAGYLRLRRSISPRLVSLLWVIVLAKPVVSLLFGAPIGMVVLEAPLAARVASRSTGVVEKGTRYEATESSSRDLVLQTGADSELEGFARSSPELSEVLSQTRPLDNKTISPAWLVLGPWLAGVIFLLARYGLTRSRLHRIVAAATRAPRSFHNRHEEIAAELGLARVPSLGVTEALDSPALVGMIRPVVLLPRWMVERGWDAGVEYALRHELAHCRWLDPLAIFVRDFATVLFHFHPAVWWAGRRHLEALELACDRESLRDASEAPDYAERLVEILQRIHARRTADPRNGVLALASRGSMARRIAALLDGSAERPLTRMGAAGSVLAALTVFALGASVGRNEPVPVLAEAGGVHDHEIDSLLGRRPSLYFLGPIGSRFREVCEIVRSGSPRSIWGRAHEVSIYDDLFENPANPLDRKPGDLLVLLLTREPEGRLPEKYRDLLPLPWSELDARLERGETVESVGTARDMNVLALAAPTQVELETLLLTSERVARMGVAPSVFAFVPAGLEGVVLNEIEGTSSRTFRRNKDESYDEVFLDPSATHIRRPGDGLLLLFTGDANEARIPQAYTDLLPKPWGEIEAALEHSEDVALRGRARGLEVLLLAAPTSERLSELVRSSPLLRPRDTAQGEAEHEQEHGAAVPPHEHGGGPAGDAKRPPDVFILGPADVAMFERVVENTKAGTFSKTGRAHEEAIYDEIFAPAPNHYDRSDGDLMVLLFSLEDGERLPEKYEDLLPRPWVEIEADMRNGDTVELAGQARGLEIVVLGAPTKRALSDLIGKTASLARYRPSDADKHVNAALPDGSRYVVSFDAHDRRSASVRLEIAPGSGSLLLAPGEGAHHLEDGYAHFLRSITAEDAEGTELGVEDVDGGRFRIDLQERPMTVTYRMALEHDASPWPEGGPDEAPYATANDAFWTGRALFLSADFDSVEVEFRLPDGWLVSTPWEPVPGRPNTFHVSDRRALSESFLLAGTHTELLAQTKDLRVLLAIGRDMTENGEELQDAVQRILNAGSQLFGGAPPGCKLLVANRDSGGSSGSLNGGVFGNSISLLSGRSFDGESEARWLPFVAHEILHLWNGGAALHSGDDDYWFSEGFTEYYAYVLCARQGLIRRSDYMDRMRTACEAYLSHVGSLSLQEAGRPDRQVRALQYDGGFVAALALDLRLRQRTEGSRSLDDLMREMFARYGTTGIPYSLDEVADIAAALAGDDLDGFFERHVAGTEPLALERELATAGLHATVDVGSGILGRDYAIHDVLHIQSLTQAEPGLVVRRSASAGYQDEDRLLAIDERPVRTFRDLQDLLASSKPGTSVSLRILREGAEITLPLVLGGREHPPLEHQIDVRFEVEAGANTSVLDRILDS